MHNLRHAFRTLAKSPGFTFSTVATLALGLGVTTAIFSVLYAVLLRPFPYPDSDRLVVLWQKGPQMEMSISWPTVQDWIKEQQTFSALSVHRRDRFNLSSAGQLPENVGGAYAAASIFNVAGLRPVLGRFYSADEDKPGAAPVVVISEKLWERRFGRNPAVLGQTIPVDGVQRTVVGIAPAALGLPRLSEVWVPIAPYAATQPGWQSRGNNSLYSFGRLKPGVSIAQARADLERIYVPLRKAYPDNLEGVSAVVQPYRDNQVGSFRTGLWSLLAATGFVLAIACANVASLFITRGIRQERDYAVRSALGASRFLLIRQMLTESLLVAVAGGVFAVLIAYGSLDVIKHFVPQDTPRFQHVDLNGWVLGFALLAALVSGVLAGLWPALKLSRTDVRAALHDGGRGATAGSGVRRFLVAGQVALTLVLLGVSGLILRSLERMQGAALGFDASSTLTFSVALPESRYAGKDNGQSGFRQEDPAQRFFLNLTEQLRTLPGVVSAAVSTTPPLNTGWQSSFRIDGVHGKDERNPPLAEMGIVSDDYFNTLRVPVIKGRAFDSRDASGPKAVIVDQGFVDKWWPGQDPLGKRVFWGVTEKDDENWFTIVGVVPTLRVYGYGELPGRPQAYWSLHQFGSLQKTVLVRTHGNPRLLERSIRELFIRLDPEIALFNVATMQEQVAATYETTTLQSFLLGLFAGLALLLALTGLYSVVAYGVSMRQREIGVRMALGAEGGDVVALMLRQGMVPLIIGVAVGVVGSVAAGQAIRSQLYEVAPSDPTILLAATALLAAAAALACWLPARRAAKVNPIEALRME